MDEQAGLPAALLHLYAVGLKSNTPGPDYEGLERLPYFLTVVWLCIGSFERNKKGMEFWNGGMELRFWVSAA